MLVKQKIVSRRRKLGISTPQLAEMIDVNQGTINRYENGTIKTIPTDKLKKLADVLGYSFEEFIAGDPHYEIMAEECVGQQQSEPKKDDELLVEWYHNLPSEYQILIKQLISLGKK